MTESKQFLARRIRGEAVRAGLIGTKNHKLAMALLELPRAPELPGPLRELEQLALFGHPGSGRGAGRR